MSSPGAPSDLAVLYKQHGVQALVSRPRADKGKPRKLSPEQLQEAIEQVLPRVPRHPLQQDDDLPPGDRTRRARPLRLLADQLSSGWSGNSDLLTPSPRPRTSAASPSPSNTPTRCGRWTPWSAPT